MVMEDVALLKLEPFIEMQRRNGLKISDSKVNTFAAREMVSCLAEAVTNMVETKIKESTFVSIGCDGSEARKTRDEKELVYCKVVSDFGFATPVFILACKSAKDFGGANADGVFAAIQNSGLEYMTEEEIENKLPCIVADSASVNFGRLTGALTQWSMRLTRFLLVIHCMNHRLELATKDSFYQVSNFNEIKEMLGQIFRMFKNSGKVWRVFRVLAETIGVFIVRFVNADGTRFQQHVYDSNSMCTMPTACVRCQQHVYDANSMCTIPTACVRFQQHVYDSNSMCTMPTACVLCQQHVYDANSICTMPTAFIYLFIYSLFYVGIYIQSHYKWTIYAEPSIKSFQ